MTIVFFGLGEGAGEIAERYLLDYYSFLEPSKVLLPGDLLAQWVRVSRDLPCRLSCR